MRKGIRSFFFTYSLSILNETILRKSSILLSVSSRLSLFLTSHSHFSDHHMTTFSVILGQPLPSILCFLSISQPKFLWQMCWYTEDRPLSTWCHSLHFYSVFRLLSSLSTFHPVVFLSLSLFADLSVGDPSEKLHHRVFPALTRLLFV